MSAAPLGLRLRLVSLIVPVILTACAAPPKPLYDWGSYQRALYSHFKGDESKLGELVDQLEAQLQATEKLGNLPPPGLHGHLALLHSRFGRSAESRRHLEAERRRFPEAAAYVDLLLRNVDAAQAKN